MRSPQQKMRINPNIARLPAKVRYGRATGEADAYHQHAVEVTDGRTQPFRAAKLSPRNIIGVFPLNVSCHVFIVPANLTSGHGELSKWLDSFSRNTPVAKSLLPEDDPPSQVLSNADPVGCEHDATSSKRVDQLLEGAP